MNSQLRSFDAAIKADPLEAAKTLGNLLTDTPEYKVFIAVLKAINSDLTIQKLSVDMRAHQTALHWGRDPDDQHAAELTRLELEMEDQPLVKAYREAATDVSALFRAVDEIVSQEAGVDFAVNARRSGCSCGG